MTRFKAVILVVALSLGLTAPASAQFFGTMPVIDITAITKIVQEIQQAQMLVNMAKMNLQALPAGLALTNVQGRISAVTGMLQQAQSLCQGALTGKALPSACNVQANTANAQAAQLGTEMTSLQSLQATARGTTGELQAQQATAQAALEVATQLQELRQAQTAAALQKQLDGQKIIDATHGTPVVDPWTP